MDFTRVNDNEVTPSTPVISAPQYAYDVFSIQGEGTGGSIRAYRNEEGYVRDNYTGSKDDNTSLGVDIGIPGHFGVNFNTIKTPTTIGDWNDGNKLRNALGFKEADKSFENVYFRNPGENSVLNENQYKKIGDESLVRFALGGNGLNTGATVEPVLEKFSKAGEKTGTINMTDPANNFTGRKKRSQVISFLNAEEASVIGLDKLIKSYDTDSILDYNKNLKFESYPRFNSGTADYHKKHHISQINVTEAAGQRYIYGIPVYNIVQKDFTFTVQNGESEADQVNFLVDEPTENSPHLNNNAFKDGYFQKVETPAYSHSFLLSGLLSPDYVDISGNGITEDDLGNAVKFNYTRIKENNEWAISKWRTPLTDGLKANFNIGKRTEDKDDKGIISYGERESWYVHSIESKTMIALFTLESRLDSKGASSEFMGINATDNSSKRLKQIDLYSKSDLKKNGLVKSKPIKTVHFVYNYDLCTHTPNNTTSNEGKLTLEKIYFTFNGQSRANKNQYVFSYGSATGDNPDYEFNGSDRWGNYKPRSLNPASAAYSGKLKNSDYPFVIQSGAPATNTQEDMDNKNALDKNAGAWMLKKILLPSGGQMEVSYESDSYAFVQNRRAADMMKVLGFGATATSSLSNQLYTVGGSSIIENNYVFIKVPMACNSDQEVLKKYLEGIDQLSFKLAVKMPKGVEFINSYATLDKIDDNYYGRYTADNTHTTIWVKLKPVDEISPLSLTAIEFLREQLPGQAFEGYDVSESSGIKQIGDMLIGFLKGIGGAFKNPVKYMRGDGKAQLVELGNCFVRLNDPDGVKYGGGYRVKSIRLKDNWKKMNNDQLYTSEYGQEYDYSTTEVFNGLERPISSGVSSYEPSMGGDENPFQTMIQISNNVPLGPASYGSIEMPMLDAFFPAPIVGYSKVTVKSIKKGIQDPLKKSRSGIGKQVTEFYTAKDFPVYYSNTSFDPTADRQVHSASLGLFFYKHAYDSRALSQGFLVETNDMHGKLKSQASYPENDDRTPINYTQNYYRNTGTKGFDEKFDFVYASQGGTITPGNMGIDVELMTDLRQFTVKSQSLEIQGQLDLFPVILPFWLPFIWPVTGKTENTYRAVTTTKVISYHSILDSVVVIDKGSQVSTKNMVYDAETGDVIVNRTNNEFKAPIFSTNYPAWWAYSGMGLAYKNIGAVYKNQNFYDGVLEGIVPGDFESGDELFISNTGTAPGSGCGAQLASSPDIKRLWVIDKDKNTSSLTNTSPDYIFIDESGKPCTRNGVSFKIVRSGHRNMLNAQAGSTVSMISPVMADGNSYKLFINQNNKVINASAIEYKEKWQTDNNNFKRFTRVYAEDNCSYTDEADCTGTMERSINPYLKGLFGTFKVYRNLVFYAGRAEADPSASTNISQNGFLDGFKLYWDFNTSSNLVPDRTSTKWIWNSKINRVNSKGMELETSDALGTYTSAQYGYNKTLPTAIANNSRSTEMFYEGFEDEGYNESLNNAAINTCNNKLLNVLDLSHSSIINTQAESFSAHTGKYVMKVNTGATASIDNTILYILPCTSNGQPEAIVNPVDIVDENDVCNSNPSMNYYFPLNYEQEAFKELVDIGGTNSLVEYFPDDIITAPVFTFQSNTLGMSNSFHKQHQPLGVVGSSYKFKYVYKTTQFVKITNPRSYSFTLNANLSWIYDHQNPSTFPPEDIILQRNDLNFEIQTLGGLTIKNEILWSDVASEKSFNVFLNCDTFKIVCYVSTDIQLFNVDQELYSVSANSWYTSDISANSYKSLYPANACYFTKPIAAENKMINPPFIATSGKKMLFSAWVKENCGNPSNGTPCIIENYTHSKVNLVFNDGSSAPGDINPAGPIIDGWQRLEGVFTVPENATIMTLKFINSDISNPIYFDDIRLHPFNANMKSYVYDPINLRLVAELDANNYASFYEYDEEGSLIRTKAETKEGIKTITEKRSAKQKNLTTIQE
ncbi:MAG TPA: hypothetical protein VK498_12490 [Ferruginibacter sp.]|nr:hypothetical protein [Ferruginibacter sp.]